MILIKGIILAGGNGTRLYPLTKVISKHLLPVYNKPMIYYPLSVLMLADIRDILIIATSKDIDRFKQLIGDGSKLGLRISYATQNEPSGIVDAFIIGEDFIGKDNVALILGDNIFYGSGFVPLLSKVSKRSRGATVFGYPVNDPERFGVVEFDSNRKVISLEEKPKFPKSNFAIPGLYFYDSLVTKYAKQITPSGRGELEITDLNKLYLENNQLYVQQLGRGFAWLDAGTPESLLEASQFVETIETRQGLKIACIEEIAFRKKYITKKQLANIARPLSNSEYGNYLLEVIKNNQS